MKIIIIILICSFGWAKGLPEWAEMQIKKEVNEVFKDSSAVVLYYNINLSKKNEDTFVEHHQYIAKLLNPRGKNVIHNIVAFAKDDKILNDIALYINAEGKVNKIKKSEKLKISSPLVELGDQNFIYYILPEAETNSFFILEYIVEKKSFFGANSIVIPINIPVAEANLCINDCSIISKEKSGSIKSLKENNCYRWKNIEKYENEGWGPEIEDINPIVFYSIKSKTWEELGKEYLKKAPIPEKISILKEKKDNLLDNLIYLLEYVRKTIRYESIAFGEYSYLPSEPSITNQRLWGDCTDKTYLLISSLKDIGINSFPILTKHRSFGEVDISFPDLGQFNHMIAAIELLPEWTNIFKSTILIDGKEYLIFDPTDTFSPIGIISEEIQGAGSIILFPEKPKYIVLPDLGPLNNLKETKIKIKISDTSSIAEIEEMFWGSYFYAEKKFSSYKTQEEKKKDLLNFLSSYFVKPNIHKFDIDESQEKEPFKSFYIVEDPNLVLKSGEYKAIKTIIITEIDKNIFAKEKRKYPVEIKNSACNNSEIVIEFQSDDKIIDLPKETDIKTDLFSYNLKIIADENKVNIKRAFCKYPKKVSQDKIEQIKIEFLKALKAETSVILFK